MADALSNAELWPIKAKGAVQRLTPSSDPEIEKVYHASMEQGRLLERSISDANFALQEKKKELLARMQSYLDLNRVANDAQLKRKPRRFALAFDVINFLNKINKFQSQITDLISAVTNNIGLLQSMEQNMLGMIQSNLNALANLVHNICNWGLPDLPAIPNLFSDTIWRWNGFNFFPLASFQPHVGFDKNFAFNQCVIHIPNVNIFRNFPSTVRTTNGLTYGTPLFVPPLGGLIPNTGQNLSDPNFVKQMQQTTNVPWYGPTFNPQQSMFGSVPDPSTIISNYHMPAQTYHDNIVSIVPTLRRNVVEPGDPDYSSPNLVNRQLNLRPDLVHFINLEAVVASNYDPYVTSAWLFYLDAARNGRQGNWIQNYQTEYTAHITPSIKSLANNDVPWNNVLGGSDTTVASPSVIPLVDTLKAMTPAALQNTLWKLSFVEASLLGYNRAKDWDSGADSVFVAAFTGADLDYQSLPFDATQTTTITLGTGEAQFPVSCTFPTALAGTLAEVIKTADFNIQNTPSYRTPHPQFRFTFDTFGVAKEVDRFSQFWREFNANLQNLLTEDPYIVMQVLDYAAALDSAIDPLATDPSVFTTITADANSRNRQWTPGTPVLKIPVAPVVTFSTATDPTTANNGWQGTTLDASAFLSRPDVQAQPISVQIAMLRTNLSAAALFQLQDQIQTEVQTQVTNAQALLQQITLTGFSVEAESAATTVPVGAQGAVVQFDNVLFDLTGFVKDSQDFVIQTDGTFSLAGNLNWGPGDAGVRTVTVFQNALAIFTLSTESTQTGPTPLQFSFDAPFKKGDVVTILATHNILAAQQIGIGSVLIMVQTENTAVLPTEGENANPTKEFVAKVTMSGMTAVQIQADGSVAPVDPTVVNTDAGSNVLAPFVDGIVVSEVLAGQIAQVATQYGGFFLVEGFDLQNTSLGFGGTKLITGGLLYVLPNGLLTQDFEYLVNTAGVQWILVVGRATAENSFIYEPQLPTRVVDQF